MDHFEVALNRKLLDESNKVSKPLTNTLHVLRSCYITNNKILCIRILYTIAQLQEYSAIIRKLAQIMSAYLLSKIYRHFFYYKLNFVFKKKFNLINYN